MRYLFLMAIWGWSSVALAQADASEFENNGYNLENSCSDESCTYIQWGKPIYFPMSDDRQWFIDNLEFAIKDNGYFLITGDMHVYGQDSAAIVSIDFSFIDEQDKDITVHKTGQFEFFNEPGNAEPIVFSGKMEPDQAKAVQYLDIRFDHSEIIAYYNIHSSCFLPCKNHKLKEEIKAFKKAK